MINTYFYFFCKKKNHQYTSSVIIWVNRKFLYPQFSATFEFHSREKHQREKQELKTSCDERQQFADVGHNCFDAATARRDHPIKYEMLFTLSYFKTLFLYFSLSQKRPSVSKVGRMYLHKTRCEYQEAEILDSCLVFIFCTMKCFWAKKRRWICASLLQ